MTKHNYDFRLRQKDFYNKEIEAFQLYRSIKDINKSGVPKVAKIYNPLSKMTQNCELVSIELVEYSSVMYKIIYSVI